MISVRAVDKTYGDHPAVRGLDFEIAAGTCVGLLGLNGAGKSTTLKILTGQLLPTEGRASVGGVDVVADPAGARAAFGYVPEEPALYDYLTAREFLELVTAIRGGGDVEDALAMTGLGGDADRLIREYSQGMRRKTALAAALVSAPGVLILDEALNGLDPPSAARVKARLRRACDAGAAVLLSTHVLETVERLADRVIMLAHGRVVADERVADIGQRGLEELFLERIASSIGQ